MSTILTLDGPRFRINGEPTYAGRRRRGVPIEGRLFNSRMIQAIVDEEEPALRARWAYPDTGRWDPERNTAEFCAMLPTYRAHGLLAVTVGLQGGGSNYHPEVLERTHMSAFTPEGRLKPAYLRRLARVLDAADAAGVVVVVSYFYWAQVRRLAGPAAIRRAALGATDWLLRTGHRHILVELANEVSPTWPAPLRPAEVHRLIAAVQARTWRGRRLPVGCSLHPREPGPPPDAWLEAEDVTIPHGNERDPAGLRACLDAIRATPAWRRRARPLFVNEDGVDLANFEAAIAAGASWGFYAQGYGSDYADRSRNWRRRPRERDLARLSGFQTLPVNWGINDPVKRAFFRRLRAVTGGS